MGSLTVYVASADLTLLHAIFNGVAMICKQTSMIWGFAALASAWRITASVTVGALQSHNGSGGAVLTKGSMSAIMPMMFAMLLTTPGLMTTVQVESTLNGRVTVIDNVPFVIAAIPAAGSLMSTQVGALVTTAYQAVGTNYPAISATTNGFLNPMKVLLSSRTAILRLGSIDSQIKTLVSACLSSDSGVDYANISNMVMNTGNSGATAAQTIEILGTPLTSIGALLYQVSLNTTGQVANLDPANSAHIYSCADGANLAAANIGTSLSSQEFSRVVQGAVNGMDQPVTGAAYDINTITSQYTAYRTANTVTNPLAGGATQANSEMINLLFSELVSNNLNCLEADSTDKTTCEAQMIQATEIERNNIQAAANEVPMLKYAGSFGNYILALIIGLGPVIVMFMMFTGMDAGKCIKTSVHIMVWPLLVMNVGAELVNGMISISVCNFMSSIAQSGYLSQAETLSIYKELSLQVGTGSHIMASLPVLMSMIFALGESAALVNVANGINPKTSGVGDNIVTKPIESAPYLRSGPVANADQGVGFSKVGMTGSLDAVSSSNQFGSMVREASSNVSAAKTRQETFSSGEQRLAAYKEAFSKRDYSGLGIDSRTGESLRHNYEDAMRSSDRTSIGDNSSNSRINSNSSSATVSGGGGLSLGTGGLGGSLNVGARAETGTKSADTLQGQKYSARDRSVEESKALTNALSQEQGKTKSVSSGSNKDHVLGKDLSLQKTYQSLLSESSTATDSTSKAVKDSDSFLAVSQKIGSNEIAQQLDSNSDFSMQQLVEGRSFDSNPATKPYSSRAEHDMDSGSTDRMLANPEARSAAIRFRAATMMARDENASPENRLAALDYVTNSAKAMQHIGFTPKDTSMMNLNMDSPHDDTGVMSSLATRSNALQPHPSQSHNRSHAATAKSDPFDAEVSQMKRNVPDTSYVLGERARQENIKSRAGLDQEGHGTAVRTAANVLDNIADLKRGSGEHSRTGLGNPGE